MTTAINPEQAPDTADEPDRHLRAVPAQPEPARQADAGVVDGETVDPDGVAAPTGGRRRDPVTVWRRIDAAVDDAMPRILSTVERVTPPDIVRSDRPGLAKVWRHARHGAYAGQNRIPRAAGVLYGVLVAVPVITVAYLVAWLVERPARAAVAAASLTALAVLFL